jgi:hypothetical protein
MVLIGSQPPGKKLSGSSRAKTADPSLLFATNSAGTTLNSIDPPGDNAIAIHFDSYEETIRDLPNQRQQATQK